MEFETDWFRIHIKMTIAKRDPKAWNQDSLHLVAGSEVNPKHIDPYTGPKMQHGESEHLFIDCQRVSSHFASCHLDLRLL